MSLDAEGRALLRIVLSRIVGVDELVCRRDCRAIAAVVNQAMPDALKLSAEDIWSALPLSENAEVKMNAEQLRALIDASPLLYSARLAGELGYQTIVNELARDPTLVPAPSIADVRAAMQVRPSADSAERIAAGSVRFIGRARIG